MLSHLRFVVHIARGYAGYGLPVSDLVQEGNIGLMKAVKRYDPAVGVRLVSFAVHWIRAEIHEYVLRNWRQVKIATTKAQRKLFFNLRRMKNNLNWLNAEETAAVARDLGVRPAEVTEMERRLAAHDMPFDVSGNGEDEEAWGPAAYLPAPGADPAEQVEGEEFSSQFQRGAERGRQVARRPQPRHSRAALDERRARPRCMSWPPVMACRPSASARSRLGHHAPATPAAGAGASRHCLKYATGVVRCARHPAVRCGKYRVQADDLLWFSESFEFMIQPNSWRRSRRCENRTPEHCRKSGCSEGTRMRPVPFVRRPRGDGSRESTRSTPQFRGRPVANHLDPATLMRPA